MISWGISQVFLVSITNNSLYSLRSLRAAYGEYNYSSYIGAAYVKYMEMAGARVVPVLINQPDEYYQKIFNKTNGLLIPGGAASILDSGKLEENKSDTLNHIPS